MVLFITFAGLASAYFLSVAVYQFWYYRMPEGKYKSKGTPSVSLLIPARNETHAITNSLHHALALDYPKLEVIVLDDESRDSTTEKIRSFAQDGVRFVQGKPLPEDWVGKNWACEQLAQAASGDYYIFCDTDVLLKTQSLNKLLRYILHHNLACVSVLPRLLFPSRWQAAAFPLLHWVLLSVRQQGNRLHSAYGGIMIFKASEYKMHGGYSRYPDRILPELHMARDFSRRGKFRFFNNHNLNLILLKKPSSIVESRLRYLRTLYRDFGGLAVVHLILTLLPLTLLFFGFWWLYLVMLLSFLITVWGQTDAPIRTAVVLPVICLVELSLLVLSVLQHQRGRISWKQRKL